MATPGKRAGVFGALLLFAAAGCSDSGGMGGEPLRYDLLFDGVDASWNERVNLIVRSDEQWDSVWPTLSGAPAPPVDFGSDLVALIALGTRPRVCHKIEIRSVEERRGRVEVQAVEVAGFDCFCHHALVHPVVLLRINRPDAPLDIELGLEAWPGCEQPSGTDP